ncbi:MAG: DUF2189 domain-containing protein [Thalassobaculum sp.]|uniref:DUF2189 domain-containing protein n=1 Tax=Thalassobaculum sp. TaxID=2022740 RepID=UPI0032EFB0A8
MAANQGQGDDASPIRLAVRTATLEDLKAAARAGLRDMVARPGLSLFFGLVYALLGALLIAGLVVFDQIWIAIAVAVGFPLVAPFLAAGLYEMSRRLGRGEGFSASDIFLVIFTQQRREFRWMSFVVLFVFWIWAYQIRLVLALTIHYRHFRSLEDLLVGVFTTSGGASFLLIGTLVGAFLATVLYSVTVIAMPLLLDRDVDFVTAMITSVQTVLASPVVMLGWGAAVGALTLAAVVPALLGVIFVFPFLGHTTWHLYGRLISQR